VATKTFTILDDKSNTTGALKEAGTVYRSRASESTPGFFMRSALLNPTRCVCLMQILACVSGLFMIALSISLTFVS